MPFTSFVYLKCLLIGSHVFQNVPPDLAICCFILEQSLSVRALQEMLSNTSVDEVRHNQREISAVWLKGASCDASII